MPPQTKQLNLLHMSCCSWGPTTGSSATHVDNAQHTTERLCFCKRRQRPLGLSLPQSGGHRGHFKLIYTQQGVHCLVTCCSVQLCTGCFQCNLYIIQKRDLSVEPVKTLQHTGSRQCMPMRGQLLGNCNTLNLSLTVTCSIK